MSDGQRPRSRSDDELRQEFLSAWVGGTAKQKTLALKQAAKETFDLRGRVYSRYPRRTPRTAQLEQARRAVRHMYRETQAVLRERSISDVTLYRGVATDYRGSGDIEADWGVLEAWTSSPEVAERFAGSNGIVYVAIIPAERILAWYDGPGWVEGTAGPQYEWIVMSEMPRET